MLRLQVKTFLPFEKIALMKRDPLSSVIQTLVQGYMAFRAEVPTSFLASDSTPRSFKRLL